MTGGEVGHMAEEAWEWSGNVIQDFSKTMNTLFEEFRIAMDNWTSTIGQAMAKASEPPPLSGVARSDPQQMSSVARSDPQAQSQAEQKRRKGLFGR
jgi:hypothetical protein